jgi:hypothetical protein
MIVLSPQTIVREERLKGQLAPRLPTLEGFTVGIIDDGFAGCEEYLRGLQSFIEARFPGAQVLYWYKPVLSRPSPPSLIEEARSRCQAVIVGVAA